MDTAVFLNVLRDEALRIARAHGFTDASIPEDIALMHSELSEALEDFRSGKSATEVWYEGGSAVRESSVIAKPCGIPSEMADIIIRVMHFCGKHGIDIQKAVAEKMRYNDSRPHKNGGKVI